MPNETTVRVVRMGPSVDAPEWALRQGSAIAGRHISPEANWDGYAALAKDIAEALYNIAPPICGGRNTFGDQTHAE